MIIYADMLIACNFLTDYFLLLLCAAIRRQPIRRGRILAAAAVGGMVSLLIFVRSRPFLCMCLTLLAGVLMCGIAFGKRKLCARIVDIGCLYAVSFAFSGITYAVWLFVAPNGLFWRNGYAYFAVSPLQFVLLVTAAYGILSLIRFIIHTVRVQSGQTVRITLQANAHTVQGVALVDSGNLLKEPISGEAVVVADRDFALPVLPLLANLTAESATDNESALTDLQFRFVQFHTIAGGGLMPAGRVAAIRSPDVRLLPAAQLYVAVCVDLRKNTGYDAIVPESAFRHDFCRSSLNKKERVHSG